MSLLFLTDDVFRVHLDCSLSLDALAALGNFKRIPPELLDGRFVLEGTAVRQFDVRLASLHDHQPATTNSVLKWLNDNRLRSVRLEELLAMAAMLQNGRLLRTALALGSLWHDANRNLYVPNCRLGEKDRKLRFSHIVSEPAWVAAWHCFPCIALND